MVIQATLNMINKKGFSVRHDRSIRCPLCYFIGESMTGMSEHFRTHLTEQTHRSHVREALRTTKLLECEDCKIRFMKMEDLRIAHDNIQNLDKARYDIEDIRPRLETCNLFKNYEFFIRNIEPPTQNPIEVVAVETASVEKENIPPGGQALAADVLVEIPDSDDEPIIVKIKKAEQEKQDPPEREKTLSTAEPPIVTSIVSVEEVRIPPPVVGSKNSSKTVTDPPSFSPASDTDEATEMQNEIIGIVTSLDHTIDDTVTLPINTTPTVKTSNSPIVTRTRTPELIETDCPEVVSVSTVKLNKKRTRQASKGTFLLNNLILIYFLRQVPFPICRYFHVRMLDVIKIRSNRFPKWITTFG